MSRKQAPEPSLEVDLELHPSGIVPEITNIVTSATCNIELDLKFLAEKIGNAIYNPRKFPAMNIKLKDPKSTVLMFKNGRIVITGARSVEDTRQALKKVKRMMKSLNIDARITDITYHNFLARAQCQFQINLTQFQQQNAKMSHYEPEMFAGLIYTIAAQQVKIIAFKSGKISIVGAKSVEAVTTAFETVYPMLKQNRMNKASR
ncbi:putative TATA-box-binding protein [Blattamonas nauphoetae]|uniref:TATA-box-binding protein n=1 Tax=Blattamonas nauphoetae TaxID=2049346 RepID=A0ABQ9YG08_9EUKA|nr:putative TATA-box-binding protein [Blattamonas nauphoetae]